MTQFFLYDYKKKETMTKHNDYYSEGTRLASLIWTRDDITLQL